jgi:hypothetical protein
MPPLYFEKTQYIVALEQLKVIAEEKAVYA